MSKKSKKVVDALNKLLADTYTLYLKTQNYHWNVTGPNFNSLHLLFEAQYQDAALTADLIAERIRKLDARAPGSFKEFLKITDIKEAEGEPKSMEMVKNLMKDQETLNASAEAVLKAAEEAGDEPTVDMVIQRQAAHQKNHWMLKAHLE